MKLCSNFLSKSKYPFIFYLMNCKQRHKPVDISINRFRQSSQLNVRICVNNFLQLKRTNIISYLSFFLSYFHFDIESDTSLKMEERYRYRICIDMLNRKCRKKKQIANWKQKRIDRKCEGYRNNVDAFY